jgi:hypothetical protein
MFSLTLFILWASFSGKIIYKLTLFTFCLFFIAINGYIFLTNLNYLNFSNMRLSFEEFHFFLENKKVH